MIYSHGPPHMAVQKQDDQQEHTFSSFVRIRDVVQKTCLRRWTIEKSGERGSGISVLPARHDDDDILIVIHLALLEIYKNLLTYSQKELFLIPFFWLYIYIYIYKYVCVCCARVCVYVCVNVSSGAAVVHSSMFDKIIKTHFVFII